MVDETFFETFTSLQSYLDFDAEASVVKKRCTSLGFTFDTDALTADLLGVPAPAVADDAICPAPASAPAMEASRDTSPELDLDSACASVSSTAPCSPAPFGESACNHAGRRANGHMCGKTRNDFRTQAEWEKYRNRRQRNNEAALRSRQRKRERQTAAADQSSTLMEENARLALRVEVLQEQVQYMRNLLLQLAANMPDKANILAQLDAPMSD